jgi:queuine/archaeosine tRNA-ribosyltransferase
MRLPAENCGKALLIKPESESSKRLHLDNILPTVKDMTNFAIVGATEKEIGNSILSRMVNVAKLRQEVDRHHKDLPIHIFGSLDTISTYLYFLAGADIFDGLTWLRYAFSDGDTIYRHAFGAMTLPISTNSDIVEGRCWSHNYQYMQQMRLNMRKFIADERFEHFGKHHGLIRSAYESMAAEIAGG